MDIMPITTQEEKYIEKMQTLLQSFTDIMGTLGIKWVEGVDLGDLGGKYVWDQQEQKNCLTTAIELPEGGLTGGGLEAELVMISRAISIHLSTAILDHCPFVTAEWVKPDCVDYSCKNRCNIVETLTPCQVCKAP